MNCSYCNRSLPEVGLDFIAYARVKKGIARGVPVCRQCVSVKANNLEVCEIRKVSVVE